MQHNPLARSGVCTAFPEKMRFATKHAAKEYIKAHPAIVVKMHIYGCNTCGGFHFSRWTKAQNKHYLAVNKEREAAKSSSLKLHAQFARLLKQS